MGTDEKKRIKVSTVTAVTKEIVKAAKRMNLFDKSGDVYVSGLQELDPRSKSEFEKQFKNIGCQLLAVAYYSCFKQLAYHILVRL